MASISNQHTVTPQSLSLFLTFIIFSILSLPVAVNSSITSQELNSMLATLRSHNYNLFSNAITTSDIIDDIHIANTSIQSFTIFAPTDASLFALDMTSTALLYTQTLRYHIVPRRLSVSDLRRLPEGGSVLQTLLPRRQIHVFRSTTPGFDVFNVDGVGVAVPGLFYSRNVAVHGLAGILSFRSPILRISPVNQTGVDSNHTVFSRPIPRRSSPVISSILPVPKFSPVNRNDSSFSPESSIVDGVSPAASPATNRSVTDVDENERSERLEKKLLEISEVSIGQIASHAGEFLATKLRLGDEEEDETLGTVHDDEYPKATSGEFLVDHVGVQHGKVVVLQDL